MVHVKYLGVVVHGLIIAGHFMIAGPVIIHQMVIVGNYTEIRADLMFLNS
jgi:hypothetical protein